MIHQPLAGMQGQATDIEIKAYGLVDEVFTSGKRPV
jgi:ATP-dependent protease ClpP protease subunit